MTTYFTADMEIKDLLFPNKKQVLITAELDECPVNPIEDYWDNSYPVLALDNHRHYSLGTKDGTAEAYRCIEAYIEHIGKAGDVCFDDYIYQFFYNPTGDDDANGAGKFTIPITEEMYHKLRDRDDIEGCVWYDEQDNPEYLGDADIVNLGKYAKKFDCLFAPVYMYDHSGMTLSLHDFSCPWDSGQLGWIVWDRLTRCRFHGWRPDHVFTEKEDKADQAAMTAMFQTYNDYVEGNVWAVSLYEDAGNVLKRLAADPCNDLPEELDDCEYSSQFEQVIRECEPSDSCGGYYGSATAAVMAYIDGMGIDNLTEVCFD